MIAFQNNSVAYADREGNLRCLTVRALPTGIVQTLDGMMNVDPNARTMLITLLTEDENDCAILRLELKPRLMGGASSHSHASHARSRLNYEDRLGNRRSMTVKALPIGIVQAIEGMLNAQPEARFIDVHFASHDGELIMDTRFRLPD